MSDISCRSIAREPDPHSPAQSHGLDVNLDCLTEGTKERKAHNPSADWSNDHSANIRLSIPLLHSRYYVTLVMGRERRSPQRRAADRQKHPLKTTGNVAFLFVTGTIVGIALFTVVQIVGHLILTNFGWISP